MKIHKTGKQKWLNRYGGRTEVDVFVELDGREFIVLWNGKIKEEVKIYIPYDKNDNIKKTIPVEYKKKSNGDKT